MKQQSDNEKHPECYRYAICDVYGYAQRLNSEFRS